MALEQIRPEIWARRLIIDTDKALVFRNVVNIDYQGEITQAGDVVRINEIGPVTTNDYTEDGTISYQTMTAAQKELHIDQKKYFAVLLDDVALAQAQDESGLMAAVSAKASFSAADVIDKFLAGLYTGAGVATANLGDTGTGLDMYAVGDGFDQVIAVFTNMHRYLDEANAPSQGRWVVVPPWFHGYLRFAQMIDNVEGGIKAGLTTRGGNGFVGTFMEFEIYSSNNVVTTSGTDRAVMFGTMDAISYASQVVRVETGRHSDYMADYIRGLYVYGGKVVRPDRLGVAILAPAGLST